MSSVSTIAEGVTSVISPFLSKYLARSINSASVPSSGSTSHSLIRVNVFPAVSNRLFGLVSVSSAFTALKLIPLNRLTIIIKAISPARNTLFFFLFFILYLFFLENNFITKVYSAAYPHPVNIF